MRFEPTSLDQCSILFTTIIAFYSPKTNIFLLYSWALVKICLATHNTTDTSQGQKRFSKSANLPNKHSPNSLGRQTFLYIFSIKGPLYPVSFGRSLGHSSLQSNSLRIPNFRKAKYCFGFFKVSTIAFMIYCVGVNKISKTVYFKLLLYFWWKYRSKQIKYPKQCNTI